MGSHLVAAMQGADAVITTATGYTRGGKNADDIDTVDERPRAKGDERDSELFELVLGAAQARRCPFLKVAPARTKATRWGALTARHLDWADSISLNAMATPAAREPGPLVTRCRSRTVAKVDSINRPS
jgi:hypothetical protein